MADVHETGATPGLERWPQLAVPRIARDVDETAIIGDWSEDTRREFREAEDRARQYRVIRDLPKVFDIDDPEWVVN